MTSLPFNIRIILLCLISAATLSGCAHEFETRKSPCKPVAGLSSNPCNPLPINVAGVEIKTKRLS